MESSGFELKWEAVHDDPDEYAGALVDVERGQAFLFYPGSARRRGMLAWQSVEIQSPAEVLCVRFREDEPLWSSELGADADLSKVPPEEVYSALEIRPLGLSPELVFVAYRLEESVWVVNGIERGEGRIRWQRTVKEPHRSHVNGDGSLLVVADTEGNGLILGGSDGEPRRNLPGQFEAVDAAWIEDALMIAGDDGTTTVFGTDGSPRWECHLQLSETDVLADRMLCQDGKVIYASHGAVQCVDLVSGEPVWRQDGPRGSHVAITDLGSAFVVQDLANNKNQLHRMSDGTPVGVEGFDRLLHWIGGESDVLAVTVEGAFAKIDLQDGSLHEGEALEGGLRLFDLVRREDRLYATAITDPESPLLLVEVARDGASIQRKTELPLAGEVQMDVVSSQEVVIRSPRGVLIYA